MIDYLFRSKQKALLKILHKYETMFDETPSTYKRFDYKIELKDAIEP